MEHAVKKGQIVCPYPGSHEIGKGLEKKIKKDAGIKYKQWVMKIEMIVERTKTGYSADAENSLFIQQANILEELQTNMMEALNLYFEEEAKTITEENLKITMDLPQFFEFYKLINAKALSERIGMNQSLLAQYIKGIKKPSPAQTQRILKGGTANRQRTGCYSVFVLIGAYNF